MSNLEFFHIFLTCNQDIKDNLKKAKGNNAVSNIVKDYYGKGIIYNNMAHIIYNNVA